MMIGSKLLLAATLAVVDVGTPGAAWESCGEVCTLGATCFLACEDGLECVEVDGATLCAPQCKHDLHCQEYDPPPPETPAGAQCWEGVCILQCEIGADECPEKPEGLKCVPAGDEGACMGEPDYV